MSVWTIRIKDFKMKRLKPIKQPCMIATLPDGYKTCNFIKDAITFVRHEDAFEFAQEIMVLKGIKEIAITELEDKKYKQSWVWSK